MAKTAIVVEEGVIQCEHGGKVVLKSSEGVHVIGGKKPMHDIDILGAPIQGCPHNTSNGGQCTKVAAISSAVTEDNVSAAGVKYLLRVDGCKTDKGAALVLLDPGQTNSVIPVKSGGSGNSITAKTLEDAKLDTKENIKKEKYRIYPLRKSNGSVKAPRGGRDFQTLYDFYSFNNGAYKSDKIVTYTDAYLYATDNATKKTTEYKVINRGDLFNPQIHDVQYKDTVTNVLRRYIPYYKETGTLSFVYSNVKLSDVDVKKFTPTLIIVESAKNACTIHPKTFSKNIAVEQKTFAKEYETTAETVKENSESRAYVSALLYLDDPIGEIEDLYNEYEFAYKLNYGYNKPLIDDIKARNQYPYAIADMLNYLYVSEAEQEKYDEQNEALSDQYALLKKLVLNDMADAVIGKMKGNFINHAFDYDLAKGYLDEVKFINNSFFKGTYSFQLRGSHGSLIYETGHRYRGPMRRMNVTGKNYKGVLENPSDILAMLIFSVCFSEEYKTDRESHKTLKDESETFYFLLKNSKPLPQINKKALDETRTALKNQTELLDVFNGKVPLIEEFEALDTTLKTIAFDPDSAKKMTPKTNYGFKALKAGKDELRTITINKYVTSSKKIAKKIVAKIKSGPLKTVLEQYKGVSLADGALDYCHYGINLFYMLSSPRIAIDAETDLLSPFNKGFEPVEQWLEHISTQMNALSEADAIALHALPAKAHYLKALYGLLLHAKVERQDKPTGSAACKSNAENFLNAFAVGAPAPETDLSNPIDYSNLGKDLKVKTKVDDLYATLKNIDGISSKFPDFEEKYRTQGAYSKKQTKPKKSSLGGAETIDAEQSKLLNNIAFKGYKTSLASVKGLAFVMTVANLGEYFKGNEKLKLHNLVQASNDLLSITSSVAQQGAKLKGGSMKSVSELVAKTFEADASSSLKFIARLGAVGVVLNSINELQGLDENDTDAKISIATKNMIVLALMFTPGWAAVGAIIAVELAWLFLKEQVVDSPLELYLQRNLYYNNRTDYDLGKSLNLFFSLVNNEPVKQRFLAPILLEAVRNAADTETFWHMGGDRKADEVKGFDTFESIRAFIADNYDTHTDTVKRSMVNEHAALKQVLYGMNAEIADAKVLKHDLTMDKVYYKTHLAIDTKVFQETRHLLYVNGDNYTEVNPASLHQKESKRLIEMAPDVTFTTIDALRAMENSERAFIIVNDDIVLKYTVRYHTQLDRGSYYAGSSQTLFTLKALKNDGLNAKDYEYVNTLLAKEGN